MERTVPDYLVETDVLPHEADAMQPDLEVYRANKTNLLPLSKNEAKLADTELASYLPRFYKGVLRRSRSPKVASLRVYEKIYTAYEYAEDSTQKLVTLRRVFDKDKFFVQSGDYIRDNDEVVQLLAEYLMALESFNINDWYGADQGDDRAERMEEMREYAKTRNNLQILELCESAVNSLKDRRLFWETELATIVNLDIIGHVNREIHDFHEAEEAA